MKICTYLIVATLFSVIQATTLTAGLICLQFASNDVGGNKGGITTVSGGANLTSFSTAIKFDDSQGFSSATAANLDNSQTHTWEFGNNMISGELNNSALTGGEITLSGDGKEVKFKIDVTGAFANQVNAANGSTNDVFGVTSGGNNWTQAESKKFELKFKANSADDWKIGGVFSLANVATKLMSQTFLDNLEKAEYKLVWDSDRLSSKLSVKGALQSVPEPTSGLLLGLGLGLMAFTGRRKKTAV